MSKHIRDLAENGYLQSKLDALLPGAGKGQVSVGITLQGKHHTATTPENPTTPCVGTSAAPPGCIAKLLTASLLRQTVGAGLLTLRTPIDTRLSGMRDAPTAGITLEHLLNHTHGFDDSDTGQLPLRKDGYIDVYSLCRSLHLVLAAPGRYYNYGNAGAWLAGAVLESTFDRPYAELLESMLLRPLGIQATFVPLPLSGTDVPAVCPAVGGTIRFTTEGLLRFLDYQMTSADFGFCAKNEAELLADIVPLPGWHSTERGVYLGWKYYGGGWFGHSSEIPDAAMLVRINPAKGLGVVVSSTQAPPTRIASMMFREHLPDLVALRMPSLLSEKTVDSVIAHRLVGEYANTSVRAIVSRTDSGQLQLQVMGVPSAGGIEEPTATLLRPAQDNIFFLQSTFHRHFPFVQFITAHDAFCEFLWNGSSILPRRR